MTNSPVIKYQNKDFVVREVYLSLKLTLKEESNYTYLWLEKDNFTTFQAQSLLSEYLKVSLDSIHYSGLKDEDAVTFQVFSVKGMFDLSDSVYINKWIKLNLIGYGKEPVTKRLLHGNCFNITLRNIDEKLASQLYDKYNNGSLLTVVNYYDYQRFGKKGGPYNNHHIGKNLADGFWADALSNIHVEKQLNSLSNSSNISKELLLKQDHRIIEFYGESYLSFSWNYRVSELIKQRFLKCKSLAVVDSFLAIPEDGESILPCTISTNHDVYSVLEDKNIARNKVRNPFVSTKVFSRSISKDDFYEGKYNVDFEFFLPTGSYATMLMKQLLLQNNVSCQVGMN